jgi:peroxiredoxin
VADKLSPGAEAPNFDLSSTEDVVLMLRDEVPRMAALLYFFGDPTNEGARRHLVTLAESQHDLAGNRAVILGISRTKLPALKQAQHELNVRFPLLYDDRDFTASYGVEAPEEGEPAPALFLVDRDQKIAWMANPLSSMESALKEVTAALQRQPAPTYHYPAKVVNRVVNWWVNRVRPRPAA